MDMGRDERPVSERWRCCWAGLGEARPLWKSFSAVADSANDCEGGGWFAGEWAAVGDAGPGDEVVFLDGCVEPPHCDMKERTVMERTERSISEVLSCRTWTGASCLVKQRAEMCWAQLFTSFGTSHDGRSCSGSPEAPPSYAAPPTPGIAGNARGAWSLPLGQPRKPRKHRLEARHGEGARELDASTSCESM